MPLFKFAAAAADDFEVVEVAAAGGQKNVTAEKATETEPVAGEIRREFENLAKKAGVRDVTNDRRIRTLEYAFDDCEASIRNINAAVEQVKKQADGAPADQEALHSLRLSLSDTRSLVRKNSTRVDYLAAKYIPAVESKFHDIMIDHGKQVEQTEAALRDLSERLDGVCPSEIVSTRRIAAEANLRALAVEQRLPELKSELFMALAAEFGSAQEITKRDRADAAREVDRLSREQVDMRENAGELSLRVKRTEEFARHVTSTVVPLLEHRARQQWLLLSCKEAEIKEAANAAEAREALLTARVQRLEEKLKHVDGHTSQNRSMGIRLAALEKAVEILSAGSKASDVPQAPIADETDGVERTLLHSIKAEILRRSIRAELCKRGKRRQRLIAAELSASAILAGALRLALRAEVRRRELHRGRLCAAARFRETLAQAVRAACLLRELRAAVAKRREVPHRHAVPSATALRAARLRRELRSEIARRQEALRRRRAPGVAALRAVCIRRELRVEIARRLEVRSARAAPAKVAKPAKNGTVRVRCASLVGGVSVTVEVPTFVSVRYLKQLIYFKTGCAIHPSNMSLVYGGGVLEDGWKVGGCALTAPLPTSVGVEADEFCGIQDDGTVVVADASSPSSATRPGCVEGSNVSIGSWTRRL